MKQKLLLLMAVGFGVLAFIFTYHQIREERRRAMGFAVDVVLIRMKHDMNEGDRVAAEDIESVRVKRSRGNTKREISWELKNRVIGRELLLPVKAGATLTWADFKQVGFSSDEGLAGIIPMGSRAVSIPVDATASVTGLVKPGDHVDIIGTFRFPEMKGDQSLDTITMTVLQNVEVLATGTEFGPMANVGKGPRRGYSAVTLALSPKEAEMIVFAGQKGRLTLSLRNFEETKIEDKLQSVNFRYLENNIENYNQERRDARNKLKGN